jgi:hypothetical protein
MGIGNSKKLGLELQNKKIVINEANYSLENMVDKISA